MAKKTNKKANKKAPKEAAVAPREVLTDNTNKKRSGFIHYCGANQHCQNGHVLDRNDIVHCNTCGFSFHSACTKLEDGPKHTCFSCLELIPKYFSFDCSPPAEDASDSDEKKKMDTTDRVSSSAANKSNSHPNDSDSFAQERNKPIQQTINWDELSSDAKDPGDRPDSKSPASDNSSKQQANSPEVKNKWGYSSSSSDSDSSAASDSERSASDDSSEQRVSLRLPGVKLNWCYGSAASESELSAASDSERSAASDSERSASDDSSEQRVSLRLPGVKINWGYGSAASESERSASDNSSMQQATNLSFGEEEDGDEALNSESSASDHLSKQQAKNLSVEEEEENASDSDEDKKIATTDRVTTSKRNTNDPTAKATTTTSRERNIINRETLRRPCPALGDLCRFQHVENDMLVVCMGCRQWAHDVCAQEVGTPSHVIKKFMCLSCNDGPPPAQQQSTSRSQSIVWGSPLERIHLIPAREQNESDSNSSGSTSKIRIGYKSGAGLSGVYNCDPPHKLIVRKTNNGDDANQSTFLYCRNASAKYLREKEGFNAAYHRFFWYVPDNIEPVRKELERIACCLFQNAPTDDASLHRVAWLVLNEKTMHFSVFGMFASMILLMPFHWNKDKIEADKTDETLDKLSTGLALGLVNSSGVCKLEDESGNEPTKFIPWSDEVVESPGPEFHVLVKLIRTNLTCKNSKWVGLELWDELDKKYTGTTLEKYFSEFSGFVGNVLTENHNEFGDEIFSLLKGVFMSFQQHLTMRRGCVNGKLVVRWMLRSDDNNDDPWEDYIISNKNARGMPVCQAATVRYSVINLVTCEIVEQAEWKGFFKLEVNQATGMIRIVLRLCNYSCQCSFDSFSTGCCLIMPPLDEWSTLKCDDDKTVSIKFKKGAARCDGVEIATDLDENFFRIALQEIWDTMGTDEA